MKNKTSKPRALDPSVIRLINSRARNQPDIPREYLAEELIKEIKGSGKIPPTLDTCKRYISKARNASNPLDEPWALSSCEQYPSYFPVESIPFLVECKTFMEKVESAQEDSEDRAWIWFKGRGHSLSGLTIRQAKWILRLKPIAYSLFPDIVENELRLFIPISLSIMYSMAEISHEISGQGAFSTFDLDTFLFAKDTAGLARAVGQAELGTTKVVNCNHDCENCKYENITKGFCTPKHKEAK